MIKLWNQLENSLLVSQIGVNGTPINGPTFPVVRFNNGGFANNGTTRITFAGAFFRSIADRFTIDFWIKTNHDYTDGAVSSGTTQWWWAWEDTTSNRIGMFSASGANGLRYFSVRNGTAVFQDCGAGSGFTFLAGSLNHVLIVQDITGIGVSGNTYRIYLNGILAASSNSALGAMGGASGLLTILSYHGGVAAANGFSGAWDNPKIGDTTTEAEIIAIINNMNNEGVGVAGRIIANRYNFKEHKGLMVA